MSSKLKVLQVIPKLGYGGAETGCFDLACLILIGLPVMMAEILVGRREFRPSLPVNLSR